MPRSRSSISERDRILAIVQARFSSHRLPGKVLAPVAGKPMLALLLERLAHASGLDGIRPDVA